VRTGRGSTAKERVFPVRLDPENLTRSFAPFPRRVKQEIPLPYGRACLRILRLIVRIGFLSIALPFLGFFSPFPHGTCTLSVIEEYLGLEGGPPFSLRSDPNSNTLRFTYRIEPWDSLQGYHLLWPDLPTFSFTILPTSRWRPLWSST
jgi:hypothetical protein